MQVFKMDTISFFWRGNPETGNYILEKLFKISIKNFYEKKNCKKKICHLINRICGFSINKKLKVVLRKSMALNYFVIYFRKK